MLRSAPLVLATGLFLLTACGGGAPSTHDLSASGGTPVGASAPSFVQAPAVLVAPNPEAPLAAELTCETDVVTTLEVEILDAGGTPVRTLSFDAEALVHAVPLVGMVADAFHSAVVTATAPGGGSVQATTASFSTGSLPADAPPLDVTVLEPTLLEPGFRLFCAAGQNPTDGARGSHICVLDDAGELIWYYRTDLEVTELKRLRNGNLLFIHGNLGMREIDLLGNVVTDWWAGNLTLDGMPTGAIVVDFDTFHHEVVELPDSHPADFLVLGTAAHTLSDYPLDVVDQSATAESVVISDVIGLMSRNGKIGRSWDLIDVLDPRRLCYDSLGGFWVPFYGADCRDWTHANAVIWNETHDELVVSMRHQDALIAFSPEGGELRWILGDHDQWMVPWADKLLSPDAGEDDFEWSYHLHAPVFLDESSVLVFDNGNFRAIPPAPAASGPSYSRAVQYVIDRESMTVRQEWAYGGADDPWYSLAVGDADPLPVTRNVLVTDGFRFDGALRWSRVFEVTRDQPAQLAFEVVVKDRTITTDSTNWLVYRAEHLPEFP